MNDPLNGKQVAWYRVERLLGRGGMASVYFAWDTNNIRPVALKVLDERYRDIPTSVDRFIHEAQTIAGWNQPNIIRVYDAGEDQGVYYYAMEYIRGLDLSQLLRQYFDAGQLMPYADVLRMGWAVAEALDFAHRHGIIHRDVKPSNVLVSVDGRVLLSDFGLVMDLARGTMGETFGSPHYIAPEQARRSSEAVPQSDIYALGVMLYEMLTGSVPFHDPSPAALALKHLSEEPPPPRSLNPRLTQSVEAVLMRALRKLPRDRYATGRELMSALERALTAELTQVQPAAPLPLPAETQRLRSLRAAGMPFPARPADNNPPANRPQAAAAGSAVGVGQQPAVTNVRPAGISQPASTNVRPVSSYRPETTRAAQAAAPPYNPAFGGPPAGPPGGAVPARRRSGFGCLGIFLAGLVLIVLAGTALAFGQQSGFRLPGFPVLVPPPDSTATDTPQPTEALTETQSPEPSATFTEVPTNTAEPTATPTLEPTSTTTPTLTPTPPVQLLIARHKDSGIFVVNQGAGPVDLPLLEIWDNDVELNGGEWGVSQLQPGECVVAWEKGGEPSQPDGVRCNIVGEVAFRSGRTRFWTRTMNIHYAGNEVGSCTVNRQKCEITVP